MVEEAEGPRFARQFIWVALLVYLTALAINILGNGQGLYPSPLNPSMWERPWKARRIESFGAEARPAIVILGSSRMMQVDPKQIKAITGKDAFNFAVPRARPLDFLTQVRFMVERGIVPELLIVGVDEVVFEDFFNRYELLLVAHGGLFRQAPFPEQWSLARQALRQITPADTWDSLVRLATGAGPAEVKQALREDGYWLRDLAAHEDMTRVIRRVARQWKSERRRENLPADELRVDVRPREQLGAALDLAQESGMAVKVVMLPVNPEYEKLVFTGKIRESRSRITRIVKEMCEGRGIEFVDYSAIGRYGGSADEFWDHSHQTPENLRRMTAALFAGERTAGARNGQAREDR